MENLALKCEICGNVYKDEVVNALMSTLVEAQERHAAATTQPGRRSTRVPWALYPGHSMQLANNTAVRLDLNDARLGDRGGLEGAVRIVRLQQQNGNDEPPMSAEDERRAQERMQAFLEELLQIYVRRCTPALLPGHHCMRHTLQRVAQSWSITVL